MSAWQQQRERSFHRRRTRSTRSWRFVSGAEKSKKWEISIFNLLNMVLYPIYSQEHRTRYFASFCSTAFIFQLVCLLFTFLPPLFTGYFTSGFYYKELTYTEQPNVTFTNRYNLIIDSSTSTFFSSSDLRANQFFQSNRVPSSLRSLIGEDSNKDDIADRQTLSLDVLTASSIAGNTINLWLLFNYTLLRYPSLTMQTLGLITLRVPPSTGNQISVDVYGTLRFQQRQPITPSTNYTANQTLIDYGSFNVQPSLDEILTNYSTRDFSTTFETTYVQWNPLVTASAGATSLTINVYVNYLPQMIRYVPNFWKEFRWAWINYVAGLVPFFYLMNKIKEFAFSNGLVRTVVARSCWEECPSTCHRYQDSLDKDFATCFSSLSVIFVYRKQINFSVLGESLPLSLSLIPPITVIKSTPGREKCRIRCHAELERRTGSGKDRF